MTINEVIMTLEEEYQLSCYEELTSLDQEKQVYLVKEKQTGEILVKKKIRCSQPNIYQILMKENFAGIPQIYHAISENDHIILIEEYIHGSSLETESQRRGHFDEDDALWIWTELCGILKNLHCHNNPIIHRDLKPSNIMLSKEGHIYLIDFNASRQYAEGHKQDTELIGTVDYAPPEQYGFRQTDCRSDIFALGVTMNRLLTGEHPNQKLPDGKLGKIIAKCIHLDPDQRYQTIEELEQDLRKYRGMERETISFLPPGFRTGVWWKRIMATVCYLFLFCLCLSMELNDTSGKPLTGSRLWFERIIMLSDMLLVIFYNFNFLGILDRTLRHFQKNILLYRAMQIVINIAGFFLVIGIMVAIEEIIWS